MAHLGLIGRGDDVAQDLLKGRVDRIELADPRLPEHLHADGELRHDGQLLGKLQRRDRDAFGGRFGADLVVGGAARGINPKMASTADRHIVGAALLGFWAADLWLSWSRG